MELFFTPKEDIPEGINIGFSTFGLEHLLWLLAFVSVFAGFIAFYKKQDEKNRKKMRIIIGVIVVLWEVWRTVTIWIIGRIDYGDLPLHLCGISIVLIGFDIIKPTSTVRSFLYFIGIPGAMMALLFPNWTVLPCMNFFNIHSFTIHALIVLYPLLLVIGGEVKLAFKEMAKCVGLLVALAIPIYFVNLAADTNFMFLMNPETGNPLGLFEQYLGSHLWGFPILLPIVMLVMYLPIWVANKIVGKKKNISKPNKEDITV